MILRALRYAVPISIVIWACIIALLAQTTAPTPIFTASTGTSCAANYDSNAKMVLIDCTVESKPVLSGAKFDPAMIFGQGNGVAVSINGITMLFKRINPTDPLWYQVTADNSTVKTGTVAIP